jgi:hypothetical protein
LSPLSGSYAVGDEVSVWIDDVEVQGVVGQVNGLGRQDLRHRDRRRLRHRRACDGHHAAGEKIGEGELEVNMPVPVTAVGGTIDTIYYEDNDSVSSGSRLFCVTGRIPSSELLAGAVYLRLRPAPR